MNKFVLICCLFLIGCNENKNNHITYPEYPKAKITNIYQAYKHPKKLGKTTVYSALDIKTNKEILIVLVFDEPVFKIGDIVKYGGGGFHSLDNEKGSAPIPTSNAWIE